MKKILVVIYFTTCLMSTMSYAERSLKKKNIKIYTHVFYNKMFGNIHKIPYKYSSSLTSINCGQKLNVLKIDEKYSDKWVHVAHGKLKGYLYKKYTSLKKPKCFKRGYLKFFYSFNMDTTDAYYWGRLYDHLKIFKIRKMK